MNRCTTLGSTDSEIRAALADLNGSSARGAGGSQSWLRLPFCQDLDVSQVDLDRLVGY